MNQIRFPKNFACLEEAYSEYAKSKAVILPVPYGGTVSYGKGTEKGPSAIIKASQHMEFYDEELKKNNFKAGICTLHTLKSEPKPEKMAESVYNNCRQLIKDNKFIVMLGGEHSISSGLAKALKEKYKDLSVLQLDAHSDLRDKWYIGEEDKSPLSKYSHACVMKRIREFCSKTVQVGIRSMSEEEIPESKRSNIFWAKDIYNNNKWFDKAINLLSNNVFITIDLDVFDPSIMSATGTPEPGGLLWYQVIDFLKQVFKKKNVVGFDAVELAPNNDKSCDFMAAKLIYRLIGYKF
ncbi:agmatinase [Candidatus Woesearchaeota archaeon]|nr:agmatinase [Candidatus Woesearchaeota archaeon]